MCWDEWDVMLECVMAMNQEAGVVLQGIKAVLGGMGEESFSLTRKGIMARGNGFRY